MKSLLILLLSSMAFCSLSSAIEPDELARRQCRSVHLRHGDIPKDCTAIYMEAVAEKAAPGTYFCAFNFNGGYIGFQELASGQHIVIFSIWDPVSHGNNPNDVPENERTQLLKAGDMVRPSRFGNEGTGGKSMGDLDWKLNEKIKFLVTVQPSKREGWKVVSGYVNAGDGWKLISSWRTHKIPGELSAAASFVEDFRRNYDSAKQERSAVYGPCYVLTKEGNWELMKSGTFTADGTPSTNVKAEIVPGLHGFRIATGGKTEMDDDFKLWKKKDMPQNVSSGMPATPGKDVDTLAKTPVIEP